MSLPTTIEPGDRIQLPAAWVEALGLRGPVVLDKTNEGILVRPCPPITWDDVFASKLPIGCAVADPPEVKVTKDYYLL